MHKMAVTLKWLVALGYVSRWMKAAEENINESAHVTVLVPAQTKQISPWNQAYLERWDNNRNRPQVHAACERWMGAEGIRRGGKEPAEGTISRGFFFLGRGWGEETAWNWFCRGRSLIEDWEGGGRVGGETEGERDRERGDNIKSLRDGVHLPF